MKKSMVAAMVLLVAGVMGVKGQETVYIRPVPGILEQWLLGNESQKFWRGQWMREATRVAGEILEDREKLEKQKAILAEKLNKDPRPLLHDFYGRDVEWTTRRLETNERRLEWLLEAAGKKAKPKMKTRKQEEAELQAALNKLGRSR